MFARFAVGRGADPTGDSPSDIAMTNGRLAIVGCGSFPHRCTGSKLTRGTQRSLRMDRKRPRGTQRFARMGSKLHLGTRHQSPNLPITKSPNAPPYRKSQITTSQIATRAVCMMFARFAVGRGADPTTELRAGWDVLGGSRLAAQRSFAAARGSYVAGHGLGRRVEMRGVGIAAVVANRGDTL